MPTFRMPGIGRETGRARSRMYSADTLDAALALASADGTIVDVGAVTIVPPITDWRDDPATDAQKNYADRLGIRYRPDITKGKLSDKITEVVGDDDDEPD
jgi:hypothetical protein